LIYLDISGFIFAQENISKKHSYSTWAEPLGSTQSASAQPQARASPSGPDSQGWPCQATATPRRACRTRQARRHRAYLRQSPSPSCHAPCLPPTAFTCAAQSEPGTAAAGVAAADSPPRPVVVPSLESRRLASVLAKSHVATGHRRFRRSGAPLDGADTFQSYTTSSRVPSSARRCRTSTRPPPEAPRAPVNQPPPSRLSLHMLTREKFCFILLRFYFCLHNSKIQSRILFHLLQVLLLDLHSVIYIISTYFF
jgi:hypothetical protein